MTEMTGEEAKTLHRLLEIGKIEKENEFTIMNYEVAPIDADVIIVDEASMVDIYLMNYLLSGIYQGTKLILVGDTDQLPSVGPGSVLKDIINSERVKTIFLDEIFRQAAQRTGCRIQRSPRPFSSPSLLQRPYRYNRPPDK